MCVRSLQGIYFTLDAAYAVEEYGEGFHKLAEVPVMLCAVVVGNSYAVCESPVLADGRPDPESFMGKPILPKADSHIAVVAKSSKDALPLPVPPDSWDSASDLFTELVVRDESQVLPLGYVVLQRRDVAMDPADIAALVSKVKAKQTIAPQPSPSAFPSPLMTLDASVGDLKWAEAMRR